jgi:hypothetical protein
MSILLFSGVFVLTVLLQQWLHRHIQGLTLALTGDPGCALRALFYFLWPGVVVHEVSHYVVARLLLVPTGSLRVGLGRASGSQITLGSVSVARTDPVRDSLVGAAPFLTGVCAILGIAGWGFGLWPGAGFSLELVLARVAEYSSDWTTWLDLYLIFAVSTAMIPSESDRRPWGPIIAVFGLGVGMLFLMGWAPRVPAHIVQLARELVDALTFALGIAVVVNGAVGGVLWLLESAIERIRWNRVRYRRW